MATVVEIGLGTVNGTPKIVAREIDGAGNPGGVLVSWNVTDDSIGASYCRISMNNDGTLKAELLDKSGSLWINHREYICKSTIGKDDVIYFGRKKIKLEVSKFVGAVWGYDISPLESVWNDYRKEFIKIKKRAELVRKLGPLPSLIGVAIAAGAGIGGESLGIWRMVIPAVVVVAVVAYQALFRKDDSMVEVKLDKLENELADRYVCPSCGKYLREKWYLLSKRDSCPHCKAKFYVTE